MNKTRLIILSIILVVLTTITYSALATNLAITGEATIRAVSDIRVTDIEIENASNDAVEEYAPKYTKNTVTNGIKLPSSNSSITYTVEITNKGDIDQAIYGISTVSNNSGLHILINGEEINSALPMIIPYRTTREITITYTTSTPSNEVINAVNTIDFREVYYITYNTKGGSEIQRQIKYQNVDINLTQERPTKTGYVFTGWTDEQNGTQVKYTPGNLYTLNSNKTLYAIYRYGEAVFLPGADFNATIKQLAGTTLNQEKPYETWDYNITSIQRYTNGVPSAATLENAVKVSTNTSEIDIFAWYSNGTIYYYTEAFNPYMNSINHHMFRSLKNVTSIDMSTMDTSRVVYMNVFFYGCSSLTSLNLSNFDTQRVINMNHMFNGCTSLTNITFGNNFDTSKVTDMSYMFQGCSSLTSLNLSHFNTSSVTNMAKMFNGCEKLTELDLHNFNTNNVTNMAEMFFGCSKLNNLNISNFNTSNVLNMEGMFSSCHSLTTLNLSHFNTSNVTDMSWMFSSCHLLTTLNISNFNTSSVTNMSHMFYNLPTIQTLDISSFDMNKVTTLDSIVTQQVNLKSLKTPSVYPTDLTITLPKTLYDPSGNGYSTLTTGNPTQIWIKLGYTVVFDKNNNDATGTMNNQVIQFDTATQLHTNTYTRYGYVFTGWNTASDGTGTSYLDGASVTSLAQANGTITLYAQWREGEATFVSGESFNLRMKTVANPNVENINSTYVDTNITNIERYINIPTQEILATAIVVSIDTSDFDIYVWYSNGTIYYYTEAINVYTNVRAASMFSNCVNLSGIGGLSYFNTSRTTNMLAMFYLGLATFNNYGLGKIIDLSPLSNWDTSSVETMDQMFKFQSIKYSNGIENWNTENVTNMNQMFYGDNQISKLDIGNYDLSRIEVVSNMLYAMSSLEQLKTPSVIPSGITIALPKTMYDENGNAYTELDSTTPTGTWLRKAYTLTANANGGSIPNTIGWTGTGDTSTKSVVYNQAYGALPTPTRGGYDFVGWAFSKENAYVQKFTDGNSVPVIRIYPGSNTTTTGMFNAGDEIEFDISVTGTTITGLDINDFALNSEYYTNTGTRLTSKFTITEDMLRYSFSFIDINCSSTATSYVLNGIRLIKSNNLVVSSTVVNQEINHTLYALWEPKTYTVTLDDNLLPSGYQRVEYIESTGTQYIDTGYVPKINTKLELDLSFNGDSKQISTYGGSSVIFGVYDDLGQSTFEINFGATSDNYLHPWFNKQYRVDGTESEHFYISNDIRNNRNKMIIENGNITYGSVSQTITPKSSDNTSSMYLFGNNGYSYNPIGNISTGPFTQFNMRVYDMKMYENNLLVRHYVPCINEATNKAGLYEVVNGVFYGNSGTGDFNYSDINGMSTKQVTYDNQYGTLSLPVREGYTFIGWKNTIFNDSDIINSKNWAKNQNATITKTSDYVQVIYNQDVSTPGYIYRTPNTIFENGKKYTVSIYAKGIDTNVLHAWVYGYHYQIDDLSTTEFVKKSFTFVYNSNDYNEVQLSYILICGNNPTINTGFQIKYIQIQEYDEETNYDITSSSIVQVGENHTIKANWIPNTYTVTYSGNGSTSGSTASSSHIYGESKTLTSNGFSRTGYVFMGWNTASDGSGIAYLDETSVSNLTTTNNGTVTLYAQWREGEATFISGSLFNKTIKELSNTTLDNITHETIDENITSVQRYTSIPSSSTLNSAEVVSTNDGDYDIYVWYENGTLYYYTEAINIYTNVDATYMFNRLSNAVSIDVEDLNTTKTTNMGAMFYYDLDLTNLNTENFDTTYVTNMNSMFSALVSIEQLNLSSFDTTNLHGTAFMFSGCNHIKVLDISNFDLNGLTTSDRMFENMTMLEQLKTPSNIPSGITIVLPKTMYDEDSNSYAQLDSTTPTEEWLRIPYTVTLDSNGGNIPLTVGWTGSGNSSTKSVIYNQEYGTLPTPTRDGYQFSGWNTDNLISTNSSDWEQGGIYDATGMPSNTDDIITKRIRTKDYISVLPSKNYLIDIGNYGNIMLRYVYYYDANKNFLATNQAPFIGKGARFTTYSNCYYIRVVLMRTNNSLDISTSEVNNLNLVLNTSISSDTKVIIERNHTLTAQWEPNTYTVNYDGNGSTSGSTSSSTHTYDAASNLTTNGFKKYGYKFVGWNTSADGTGTAYLDEASVTRVGTSGTVILYAQWIEGEATLVNGRTFNYMLKELAGTDTTSNEDRHLTYDYNVKSVQKYTSIPTQTILNNAEIISIENSDFDIYAWYENGTIYYYTEAVNIYMNSTGTYMFYRMFDLEDIDISTINTSRTTSMGGIFENCIKLKSINLSNFDTQYVNSMWYMFSRCESLETLDISSFDMSSVSNATNMFTNVSALEQLKTPKVISSGLTITLPTTMYDENGNAYTELDSTTPTEEWLRVSYIVTFDMNGNTRNELNGLTNTNGQITSGKIKYSINNGIVEVTSTDNDGFGFTTGRVNLEANKTYIFNCDVEPGIVWLPNDINNNDTIGAYLMLNGQYETFFELSSYNNYEFTPRESGTYWLRLDVNQSDKTHTFGNMSIIEKSATKEVIYGQPYGTLPSNPTREGYTFAGWNGKNLLNYNDITTPASNTGISVDNNGNIYDSNPVDDYRSWGYESSNWHSILPAGTYTLSLKYSTLALNEGARLHSAIQIRKENSVIFSTLQGSLYNKEMIKATFTLNETSNIGILIKSYDGIYKIQLEEGNTMTEWESYYITSSTTVVQDKDHTLKAIWTPNTYTINYNGNGNTGGSTTSSTHTYDVSSNLTANGFSKTGYKFIGWNTSADGTGTAYLDGASVTRVGTSGTVTLYAQWTKVNANNIQYNKSEVNCTNVQCMIDELYYMLY